MDDAPTFAVLGWPPGGPVLRLDHEAFSYAGKFVMSNTGKAVATTGDPSALPVGRDAGPLGEGDGLLGAVAFNEDRTDDGRLWLRYVTVQHDRRGEGIGPRLVDFVVVRARERGYDRVAIAVNNPFAYQALYKAGFRFTGERTGIAELVLERPTLSAPPADADDYRAGLAVFADRDPGDPEASFLAERRAAGPPGTR